MVTFVLSGCGSFMTSDYQQPELDVPAIWQYQQNGDGTAEVQDRWWEGFGDPVLNALVDEALKQNNDLLTSALQVRTAMLQADAAHSDQLPELSASGSGSASRNLSDWGDGSSKSFSVSGALSYEVDLWGKLANTTQAARLEAQATIEDYDAAALSLIGTVVSEYYELGYLNHRIALSQESIDYAKRSLELVKVQKEAGAATPLELMEAEQNLASQEASHASLIQERVEARNTLSLLFGGAPRALTVGEPKSLDQVKLPEVAAGLPAELISRRPDVRAAEKRIRSALADTDATRASLYPTFSLTGSVGDSSDDLSDLLSNPVAVLAGNLALPFLQWRDVQRDIEISQVAYEQYVVSFKQTLYEAMAEVENSLSAGTQYRLQEEKLDIALDRAKRIEAIYKNRYENGAVTLKTWLDAQEDRRQAEISSAENRLNQLQNLVTLCKALGGGVGEESGNGVEAIN